MENSNSEIHNLITGAINTLRQDFRERADSLEKKLEGLRGCFVSRSACQQCHEALQRSCDERHDTIDKRMVDKGYFAGGVGVLLFVIAVVGVVLSIVRF